MTDAIKREHCGFHHGLSDFDLRSMIECGKGIRDVSGSARTMEEAGRLLVSYFRNTLSGRTGLSDCALVRLFKTHPLQSLPPELKERAKSLLARNAKPHESIPCLTLLATAGEEPAWNDRTGSLGHAAIPLQSVEVVERAPMIAQLISQMGLDIGAVLAPSEQLILQADEKVYGVFLVPDAVGSPFIPAQDDFVLKYGLKSVLGFGGLLPSGDLFAMILFSNVPISRETANLFRTLALSVRLVLLPFTRGPVFNGDPPLIPSRTRRVSNEQEQVRSEIATLKLLLPALEEAALYQTDRLEDVVSDLQLRADEVAQLGSRLSSMLESTTDAVFLLDREWRFTYVNRHAMTLLRAERSLLGKTIWGEFPAAVDSIFWQNYHAVMENRRAARFEEHYPEPLDRWFDVHVFPSDPGIAVFFHDVTDRRKADAALIKNEKLAAVGRLAASIAHEINNPLESVTNLLYLARSNADPGEVQSYLATADRELRRAAAITSQTLRFHRQSTEPTEMTATELIEDVLSIYQGRLINSKVKVETRDRAARSVLCFEGEIRQVLNNLVGNAIDAMHPLGGRLLVRTREATDWRTKRRGLVITIADDGPGMTAQARARSFEPFFTTKGIGGTGLGLWISREIVTRHKGTIRLKSRQAPWPTGTVFATFLPFDAALR